MHIPNLTLLHPKCMTIRRRLLTRSIQSRKAHVYIHNAIFNVNYVAPIDDMNGGRQAEMACRCVCVLAVGVGTAFEAGAGGA
jgi:hypothetical protein